MAGYIPGLLPANHSQEKEFAQAYEDVLERYKGKSVCGCCSVVKMLPREKGRMRFHRLQNVQIALDFLKQRQVKLVNIRNDDITDGNPKLTLGLIWTIILHFQVKKEGGDVHGQSELMFSEPSETEKKGVVHIREFEGQLCVVRTVYPRDYGSPMVQQSNRENLEQAFEIAESLGVTRLLDAEDVDVSSPDEKSVITYVCSIYDAFPKIPEGGEGIAANEVDQRWTEYQSGFSSLLQWTRQHTALMTNRSFPHNPVNLKALYNEYVHFKETEVPAKEREKSYIEHLYKLLEAWIEFGRIKLPQGLHPNDLEEEWGKLILEMLEREKALRPAVERLELLLQKANKIQNMALDCEEKLTLAKNTLQADLSQLESGQPVRCENELGMYLQDCEALVRQLHLDLQVLRDEKYYQLEQLAFRVSCLQEELVSLRLQCASVYRKGHFSTGGLLGEHVGQRGSSGGLATLGAQTLLGAVGAAASLLRRPMSRADLLAMSSSEDEGSLRFIYELLGWVEETQDLLERAEWGSDLPSVEQHLQDHHIIHTAVEDLLNSLKEARNYESRVSPNLSSSYSETLSKLENQYCKLLEHSSWRLRCLESLRAFVSRCTEELIWLNEREEEELAFDWSDSNTNMAAKREQSELEEKQEVMHSLQETVDHLCQENHPAKQTVEAYSAALQTQWQWIKELCICVEQHLKDNTAYFQFMSDARDCENYLRQLQDTIKRQYTCDKNSRLGRLEDLLQDSMEEKEQLIEYRSTVASLVGRAKSVVQLRPRSADSNLGTNTPIRAICDYRQIEITISKGEECVLEDNSQRTKWKVISPTGNEAMVPSVCFTIPPPNQEAIDTAIRMEQMYQNVMSLWHQLHVNMKSVVSWHYLQKDILNISSWSLDTVSTTKFHQFPIYSLIGTLSEVCHNHLSVSLDALAGSSRESTPTMKPYYMVLKIILFFFSVEKDELASRAYLSELQSIKSHLEDAESRLMRGIQTPHPSTISGDNTVHIAEQEKLQQDLKGLQSDLGEVSRRCVSFFEEKPSSSSVPVLRSELNLAIEHIEKLNSLSSVYLQKLKTVDVLMRSLQAAESQVRKYESRLSEEDIVPADTAAIQALGEQLKEQDHIFKSLSLEVQQTREVRNQLNQLHPDRSPELDRYQEKAQQLTERWSGVSRHMETRQADLEMLGSVLQQYREGHTSLIHWIEETTKKQENTQPEQTDSRALSEQLAQQTALVAEIEQNQVKLDECQTYSKQYCAAVKDYELQLMTFRAFVESTQKSPVKRRRMHSSSDVITQEFMDLRTRYTALVTLTTQHVKYISDALRRLEEEEVCYAFLSLLHSVLIFTYCILAQRAQVVSQLDELTATYTQLCDSSNAQLQQLEEQLAKEEKLIAGVIDLGTMETFPVFQAAQRGLIDQDTCHVLLEAQVIMGGLFQYDSPDKLSLDKWLSSGLIDKQTYQSLEELETALGLVNTVKFAEGQELPVATAMKEGVIKQLVGLRILELQISTGSLKFGPNGEMVSLDNAREKGLLSPDLCQKLQSCLHRRELIDPNTAEKLSLVEFQQRCVVNQETGLRFFPVKQKPGGTVCLCSGRKVGIFCAVQEGLIDRHVTVRLLEAQLFAGGITDPRSGHRLTVNEAVRHGLMDQDLACTLMTRQLQAGGIIDPISGERLELDEAIKRDLLSPRIALHVLQSLQSFMAMMWPESGELLHVSEALQQGVVNRELAAKALRKRHSVGAVYLPESGQVVPLHQADKILKPQAVEILKQIQVPDVLPNVTQSSSSYMKRLSSGSAYSSSPPASHADVNYDFSIMEEGRSEEQVQYHLLTQVMTHSYIDAHSGERLVLLEPELVELICENVKTTNLVRPVQHKICDNIRVTMDSEAISGIEEEEHEEPKIIQYDIACKDSYLEETIEIAHTSLQDTVNVRQYDQLNVKPDEAKTAKQPEELNKMVEHEENKIIFYQPGNDEKLYPSERKTLSVELSDDDVKLGSTAMDLQQGGLVTVGGQKVLLDEALAQGLLPGHTAIKLMEKAGLFGGFLDIKACKSLSVEDVMQEGLLDEDLMARVRHSENILAGVIDVEHGRLCSVKETLTQHSVTTCMAKTDQGQEAIDVSKDLATDISEKKRKKKSKSKKVKQVCIVEAEGVEKRDDETEKEHKTVIHEVELQSSQSDEKESMKQLEKANQAMAQKEKLLMKAKESILRKVFERGVSEKQAAEELEAMRQVASNGEYRITTQEETIVEKTSYKPPQSKKNDNKLHQTGQEMNKRSVPDMAENLLPGSDSDLCSSAKAQLQKQEEDQHDKHTNTGLSGDDMNQNIPSMKTSDDIVNINQKELVLIQNLEGETKERTAEKQSIEPLYTDEMLIEPMSELTLPSSTAVTDSHEIAKSIALKCVFDIPAVKDSKALLSSEVIPESATKQKEEVEEYAEALVEPQPGEVQINIEQIRKDTTKTSLARQECLEHDQQIVALLSMVRHIEVRLKQQQQQQSVGRGLSTIDDIIKQIEVKDMYYSKCLICCQFNRLFKLTSANSLAARSNEVSNVAFNIQVFISEHAQDLLPDQSRRLLGQLEQLQRVFHQAVGLSHARAEALSAQQARENQQMRKEQKEKEERMEKERQTTRDREVEKDLQTKSDLLTETIHSVEELLSEQGDSLSPEERAKLQGTLSQMKEKHGSLTNSVRSSLSKVDTSELQQLQAQQAHLQQVAQSVHSLLEQPDSSVPPEEKQRLRAKLEQLQNQHQERLQNCQDRLRQAEALGDEFAKFVQEHGNLGTWLDQSEQELRSLGEGETDAKGLKDRIEEHKKVGTKQPCILSVNNDILWRYQHYQDEAGSLVSWLSTQEQNQSVFKASGEQTDTQTLQHTLSTVQDELAERSVQLEKVRRAGKELVSTQESPALKNADINNLTDTLEKRFEILSNSVSVRAELLQTAVAQSVSVQEGLKALLAWLDGLPLSPGAVQATAQAVQDALTQNQKIRQELLSRQGSLDATLDSVSKLLKSADASTASGLQGALQDLSQRYTAAQAKQAERETELRGLLPKLESFERQSADLHSFTQSRERALSPVGQPDCKRNNAFEKEDEVHSQKRFYFTWSKLSHWTQHCVTINKTESFFNGLFDSIQSCVQQLAEFRSHSGSLLRWLQTVQEQLPAKEPNLSTESLQRRAQQLKVGLFIEMLNLQLIYHCMKNSTNMMQFYNYLALSLACSDCTYVNIPSLLPSDLTEIQVAVADVNCMYEQLGSDLRERKGRQEASLDLRQKARQGTEALIQWLSPREQSLAQGQTASPSRPEVVRAQAQETKVLFSELAEHSGKVEDLKNILKQLITDNPDSPEAETWKRQLEDIDSRWTKANQTAAQKQTELEVCADRLDSFAAAASQLGPWLREKELMMSVLGPLSIDPNMLNTQKQQVQFMLREFETRQPQFDQLTRAAEGILSPSGDEASRDGQDLEEVRQELADVSQQWEDLTARLTGRSQQIDQAQGTSECYLALLRELSQSMADLGERLDAQTSLSAQPEALRRRLQETGEIRAVLEQRRGQLAQAEQLCLELSTIVAEPYLRDELHKRLESVSGPLKNLEERAADGLSQLQAALSSTQQFQQMFDELRGWLDGQAGNHTAGDSEGLPCQPDALKTLLAQQEDLQRAIAQQRGSYELIQAEGTSLLASLPAGDERLALQTRLNTLRQDWEGINQQTSNKHSRIKETLSRAELYQQHRNELVPWVAECEEREAEIHPSLDPSTLDEALQKARQLSLDLDRRRRLLDSLNMAADQLLEQSCTGEEEVMDEKAQLNRRIDGLSERLQGRTAQIEELGSRLKEFEDGRLAVERRLEAARHQIEVQEALGPQACSNKSLERLRSQQELLNSIQPQVVYLQNLALGLLQDAPEISRAGEDGGQRLLQQARDAEKEFEEVTEKTEQCCLSLESRLQGVGEVQSHVRDVFSRLADLDDELDSLSPVGRDTDSLASQADAVRGFLSRLSALRAELESHGGECTTMLRREGSSPDLLALRRETEALSRQAGKLAERGQNRLALIEAAEERMKEFYARLADLQGLLGRAEEVLDTQAVVGTEVEVIKQQLQEFKAVEREQIDSIQPKLQHVNAVGQGLIQSAAKHTDTQGLEHDLETTNLRWNSLNKRVAERIAQLQEALLHCGKFQDALEPLLSWLSDTEELIANQKPPSAEYRVVKAQIQEQKLLQRLLDDRLGTVEMIRAEGERIAATAETQDRDKIQKQLKSLGERWTNLLEKASARQRQLEELQVLALQFHEAVEPLGEWLSTSERRLSSTEPMGTQTSKITQQIVRHKVEYTQQLGEWAVLYWIWCIKSRYAEMTAGSSKALRTLEQALQLATRFASSHDDISQWLDSVEAELNNIEPDTTPAYQDRQRELKCVSAEKRLVLDTVNEVGSALLDLVPWCAREGLDRLVADANQRYRQADMYVLYLCVLLFQYEEAVDAELTWVGETERKLASLGPLSLEPDLTVAQLQVQRAFNIDIIRHKDTVDQLLKTREDILESCSEQQREALKVKTDSLSARYEAVNQSHAERFSALEQAQVLVARFWETYEELEPWLGETETLITQQAPPAIDTEALRQQQDQMRLLRESIAEHKPHIDKLLKIGPQLAELSAQEGATLRQRYNEAERRYLSIKEEVKGQATALDEAVSQSVQFHDKMDPLLETLEGAVQRLRQPPPVAAEVEKIREQLAEHRVTGLELDKLLPSFSALCARGEELIGRAPHDDPAAQAVRSRLLRLRSLWDEIRQRAEEREGKLQDVLDLAGKFWADMAALLSTLRDSQDIVKDLEDPGVDPSLIKQQIEAAEAIKQETDGLREELEIVRTLGADLIFACGETEKPEVKKTIDEMNAAWEVLNRTWRERMERLEEAMTASVLYQDALQGMFDYLDNAVIKLCDMPAVGTDLSTVKQQIEELKQYKVEVYQQQIDMEKLCHQGELLLKKVSDQTDRDMIQEPLTELRHLWDNLVDKITIRQHKLEGALLALGQFQHALSELQSWLSHTHATLDTQRPISSDPKAIEIELAKHHVLRNDVLSHRATVETVNSAGSELLESSPGDEINHLRDQLDELNRSWKNLLLKTDERQKLLEAALQQAEGFHGELEEFLLWLRRTESQLSAAKPTGGLPETAREQLQQHMELQAQLTQRTEQYHRLLDQGESILLARGGEDAGPGTTQTQQNLAMLQNKWASLNTKMDDRRDKLEEAVSLATGFQTSLQDTINWLTQAEQTLNMAQPPSLILDTVLFQIDEHKVFVNEVNTHREQVLALEKAGSQLRFASLKQDVVLIKNLLLSVQARWDKLVQRSLDRGRHLDEARKRAKQFHEAWRKLTDWLEEAESRLDSELEISNEPDKIKIQLAKHKEFQKSLGSKQPVYDTTVRSGKAMRDKATLPADTQKLDNLLGEVRDKWDTVCGKSVERQHKLEEALLFSGQFAEALQALVDWLYRVEPQLAEDQPVHGDLDLVSNLMDSHKVFQKELGKRTSSVQALKRSARELMETGRDDTAWVKVQLQELSNRWETVCALSVSKQTRLQQALKQAEEFRTAVQMLLEWLSEAEQTLRFRGVLPEEVETLQALLHTHRDFMQTVEEKRVDVNKAAGMGEAILAVCHPDCITTIKHWITIIRARFEEVLTWTKQHEQRLETALTELLNNAALLEELLSWLQWAETTLVQQDTEPLPQDIPQLKTLITEHQVFMEEMTRKQPDVDKVTKTYKRKPAEHPSSLSDRRGHSVQVTGGNPRLTQLCSHWQQVWLLALDRQRKLNDALDRLEELKEFANFDFDVWRKKYMRWMNHKKSRVMDFFRRIDKDQDGKITRQEFIDGILASKFPTSKLEMTAVADIFDRDCDGYIDYYEFVAALHPNKDAYRPTTDADKIEDEVTRQVAQCKCAKRFQVEQIGENKYRVRIGCPIFGDSQQLRLVRILRSTVMVRVGGGWMALDEFLVKNDPCRVQHPGLKIFRSDSSSSISSHIGWVFLSPSSSDILLFH
uniref:Microtubule-actin cross-linking factor 1-like n=1 Tax=Sinocyclocheilus anshuiensis TaxID=1608454 RepID=A0A671N7S8_9TELE